MISFNNFPWSALFAGVIGGVLGAIMLRRKIFGDQGPEREQADDEHEEEDRDRGAPDVRLPRREPVEHDYIPEIWILLKWVSFLFFSSTFLISKLPTRGEKATATT